MKIPGPQFTLAVDFDGVIHDQDTGDLVVGTYDALIKLRKKYKLVVFTARHDLDWVRRWLADHFLAGLFADVTNRKPRADTYLDDHGMHFIGWDEALGELL